MESVKPTLPRAGARSTLDQRWRHLDKSAWVWLVAIVVLVFLVVNPLARLFIVSFQDGEGAFTFGNYVAAYSRLRNLEALGIRELCGPGLDVRLLLEKRFPNGAKQLCMP